MKNTGLIRQIDDLGRVTLPIELRRSMGLEVHDSMEIAVEGEAIVLRKYEPNCVFCGGMRDLQRYRGKNVCRTCREAVAELDE